MKIRFIRNGEAVRAYNGHCRVIDHYESKVIDVIKDDNTNLVEESFEYEKRKISFLDNPLTLQSEASIVYHLIDRKGET